MKLTKIHQDARGEIWVLLIEGKEHTFLTTKKNFARGGCVHRFSQEHAVVIKGTVEYHVRGRRPKVYGEGESISIPPDCPHYFIALEDSITLEWGPSPEEKREQYKQWRKVVDKINEEAKASILSTVACWTRSQTRDREFPSRIDDPQIKKYTPRT